MHQLICLILRPLAAQYQPNKTLYKQHLSKYFIIEPNDVVRDYVPRKLAQTARVVVTYHVIWLKWFVLSRRTKSFGPNDSCCRDVPRHLAQFTRVVVSYDINSVSGLITS